MTARKAVYAKKVYEIAAKLKELLDINTV